MNTETGKEKGREMQIEMEIEIEHTERKEGHGRHDRELKTQPLIRFSISGLPSSATPSPKP